MKRIYLYLLLALVATSSCKKQLADINKNPNAAETAQPDFLLTAATKLTADTYWGVNNNMNASLLMVQHWSKIQYTDPDRYIYNNGSFQEFWTTLYSQSITDLNKIISLAEAQGNPNYKGVALVLRSWVFALLTDAYGDVPYSQAGKIDEYLTPAYDKQKDVYNGVLNDLKTAQDTLNPSGKAIAGDVLYSNQIGLWKKFANALRLRIALRIADRDPDKAKQVIADVLSSGILIGSNAEGAQMVYDNSPNQNPVSNLFDTRDDYRISKSIVSKLYSLNDPRLPIYATLPRDTSVHQYVGVPNGLTVGDASSLGFYKTSWPGAYFRAPRAPAVIMSYAEVLFGLAEAAARGFTSGNAADLYAKAIKASFEQYGITDNNVVSTYLAQPAVQYNAAAYKQSIGEQKWIALFGQGLEAFAEWRRLDYPRLSPAVASVLGSGLMPVRFIYPGTEQTLNGENYKKAVSNQGTDVLTTKLWFDAY